MVVAVAVAAHSTLWTGSASRTARALVPDPYAPPPMGLRRYRDLLRVPGVAPLMLAAFVGRMPYGMNILAEILLLRAAGFKLCGGRDRHRRLGALASVSPRRCWVA